MSQVTPGGGALKIKLSKKAPLKITAGAPDRQSETIPMELERIPSSKRPDPKSPIDTTSKSTLPTRGSGAPLFITPILPENDVGQQGETATKRENGFKSNARYGLTKERVTQVQSSGTRRSQGPVRIKDPLGNGGGRDSSGGTSGDQRFPGEGRGPPRRDINQAGGGGDDDPDPSDDGDGDDSSSTDPSAPRRRKHKSPKYVYVIQGPPGPKGQEGQPGQAGRDGRDGQNFTLTKELEETLKAHRPNLDTTGLENSFDQFGRTMFEVLNAQHRTNQKLEEQFRRANETQEYQAEAMQDMAQANFQMKYDHMFAGVPMYDGTDPDTFDDWLYQIESLCELSRRNVRVELMGRASAQVKRIIRSLPLDIDWEIAQRELKRCLTEEKSRAHSAFKLAQIKQKPNENLKIFILRYQDLHSTATGKTAAEDTDPTHIIRFLGMMTNSEIARKITQKGIPEGMTLGQAFTRAIELEAGYQLSEGVSLARPPEIMQIQGIEEVDEVAAMQNRFKDVVCWGCAEKGHLYRDCPHRRENVQDDGYDPITFASGLFKGSQLNWAALTKEAFAIYSSIKKLSYYLEDADIVLRSDHLPLKKFLHKNTLNTKVNNWAVEISPYRIQFEYIKGIKNTLADTMSRLIQMDPEARLDPEPEGYEFGYHAFEDLEPIKSDIQEIKISIEGEPINLPQEEIKLPLSDEKLLALQTEDKFCSDINNRLQKGQLQDKNPYYKENEIFKRYVEDGKQRFEVVVLPQVLSGAALQLAHEGLGHNGSPRTYALLKRNYFWKGLKPMVKKHVQSCKFCQEHNKQSVKYSKYNFEAEPAPMKFISMDLIGEFHPPSSKGNRYALTVICMFTGYAFCIPLPDKKAETVLRAYMNHVYCKHGGSLKILSDNGTEFKNRLMEEVSKELGVEYKVYSPPYRLQSNGRIESFHYFLKACIAKHITTQLEWDDVVPLACAAYNFFPNEHSRESPFFLMFGRDPLIPLTKLLRPKL